jgi:hypothetical protein
MPDEYNTALFDAKATAAVFAGTMATGLAIFYALARVGFTTDPIPIFLSLGLSLFFLCLPSGYLLLAQHSKIDTQKSWAMSDTMIAVAGIGVVTLWGMLVPELGKFNISPLLASLGYLLFLAVMVGWWRTRASWLNMLIPLGGAVFAIWSTGLIWGYGFNSPLFLETLALGHAHRDPLFHATVASMIQTYGIPSTGLDGLPYMYYHWGSHWLAAQWSSVLGTSPLEFYQLGYYIIIAPLFIYSMLSFSVDVRSLSHQLDTTWSMRRDVLLWVIFISAFVGLIPIEVRTELVIPPTFFTSPSQSAGLAGFFFFMSLILISFTNIYQNQRLMHNWKQVFFLIGIIPVCVIILGFLKISHMPLFFISYLYIVWKLNHYKSWAFILSLIITSSSFLLTLYWAHPFGEEIYSATPTSSFLFKMSHINMFFFFIFAFFFSWCYAALRLYEERIRSVTDVIHLFQSNRIIDLELLFVLCVVGISPAFVFALSGGDAGNFYDVQRWVAVSLLVAHTGTLYTLWSSFSEKIRHSQVRWLGYAAISATGFLLFGVFVLDYIRQGKNGIETNVGTRIALKEEQASINHREVAIEQVLIANELLPAYTDWLQPYYERRKVHALIIALQSLSELPVTEKRDSLLFIPRSTTLYWDQENIECAATPFIAPSITGIAMLDGLPASGCNSWAFRNRFYGYSAYAYSPPPNVDPSELCSRVKDAGFSRIIILDQNTNDMIVTRHLSCE